MNDRNFEREVRAVITQRAEQPVPRSLFDAVAALRAERSSRQWRLFGRPGFESVASAAVGIVGALLVVVIGALLVLTYVPEAPNRLGPGSGGRPLAWETSVATLEADLLTIEANGQFFSPPVTARVRSDPGTATYRTLEIEWVERGIEQRLYIYFAADEAEWWVAEIRTRDGLTPAEWISYQAPQIGASLGQSYEGDIDLTGDRGAGRLRISRSRITAFAPGTGKSLQPGCRPIGAVERPGDPPKPQVGDPDLSRFGITGGMEASEAGARLTGAGACHEYRLQIDLGGNLGYAQVWCSPPPGFVEGWAFGSEGVVVVFVRADASHTLSPNLDDLVGC